MQSYVVAARALGRFLPLICRPGALRVLAAWSTNLPGWAATTAPFRPDSSKSNWAHMAYSLPAEHTAQIAPTLGAC